MKVFFDTSVLIAAAIGGARSERILLATLDGRWKCFVSMYVLDEYVSVTSRLEGLDPRDARRFRNFVEARMDVAPEVVSRHRVSSDEKDSPILRAALGAGGDFLVTYDDHLIALHPYQTLQILHVKDYGERLRVEGLL